MSRSDYGTQEHVSSYNSSVRAERCFFCPARHGLQTHHLVPQRMNGSDLKENLVIVCGDCHDKLEKLYDRRFYERLGLSDDKGEERSHFACFISDCRNGAVCKVDSGTAEHWFCKRHVPEAERFEVVQEVSN